MIKMLRKKFSELSQKKMESDFLMHYPIFDRRKL